jgi:hypothetical protein
MSSMAIAVIAFACAFGGAALGIFLRAALPESHWSDDSKEVIKLGTGFIGTMVALVLGLLVASATSAFNSEERGFQQLATNCIMLDRALAHYGPEAKSARERLRHSVDTILNRLWPANDPRSSGFSAPEITVANRALYDSIRDFSPRNDAQRLIDVAEREPHRRMTVGGRRVRGRGPCRGKAVLPVPQIRTGGAAP